MSKLIDRVVAPLFGETRAGALSYRGNPARGRGWGGPMNGQKWRCLMVAELIRKVDPAAIVETGTYLGTTTEWMTAFQIPVYSCEASERNFGFARQRMIGIGNAHLTLGDSRSALRSLVAGALAGKLAEPILFYLDAHWNEDLPLAEELDIIYGACPRAVVLIDDFQVPGDAGYGFDDYGKGKALTAEYIDAAMRTHDLQVYYPTKSAAEETGARRGCAVLVKSGPTERLLSSVTLLRPPVALAAAA